MYDLNPFKFIETSFMAHIWSMMENVLCELEKNVHSPVVKWKVL